MASHGLPITTADNLLQGPLTFLLPTWYGSRRSNGERPFAVSPFWQGFALGLLVAWTPGLVLLALLLFPRREAR